MGSHLRFERLRKRGDVSLVPFGPSWKGISYPELQWFLFIEICHRELGQAVIVVQHLLETLFHSGQDVKS